MEKICVFGDSLAKGVAFDGERYYPVKENFVNVATRRLKLACQSFARFGSTVLRGKDVLTRHLPEIREADCTVIEFGGNDCDFDWAAISADPDAVHDPHTPMEMFRQCYRSMIETVRSVGKLPLICNLPPIDPERYFARISRGLNPENILRWLGGDVRYIYRFQEMYSVEVDHLAAEEQTPLLDLRSVFLGERRYVDLLCDDGIHPNEKGHRLIGDAIADRVGSSPIYLAM